MLSMSSSFSPAPACRDTGTCVAKCALSYAQGPNCQRRRSIQAAVTGQRRHQGRVQRRHRSQHTRGVWVRPPDPDMLVGAGNNHVLSPVTKASCFYRQSRAACFLSEALSPQKTRPVVTAKTWGLTHESPAGRSPARPALSGLTAARSCSDTESAGSAWGPDVGSRERSGEVQGTADSCSPESASADPAASCSLQPT